MQQTVYVEQHHNPKFGVAGENPNVYLVVKLVNRVEPELNSWLTTSQVRVLIEDGVTVNVVSPKSKSR